MKGISTFQIGLYAVFGVAIIVAVLIFSGKIPVGSSSTTQTVSGSVTMWGTLPYEGVRASIEAVKATYKNVVVVYSQKDPATFQRDLTNALASGTGPDLVTVTPADVIPDSSRILTIPYTSLPEATFRSTFVDQGSLFLTGSGSLAFPFSVDPMVMFYNKDLLASAFVVTPPKTWDDLVAINKKITVQDNAGKLSTETVALGTYGNVSHAKELIAMLIRQAGNNLVALDTTQKKYVSLFGVSDNAGNSSVTNAINFYTSFANPSDADHYSWNPTLPTDRDQFQAGKLAIYFGFASEIQDMRKKNPNLNFDVTYMPQRGTVPTKNTYGSMTGIGIVKMSANRSLAVTIAQALVGKDSVTAFIGADPQFAPARTDMLGTVPGDALSTMIYNSSIISHSFIDPDPVQTGAMFKKYIDQINAGLSTPQDIITPGDALFTSILDAAQPAAATPDVSTQ